MTILEIQRALKARGYDPGLLDGRWGRRTRKAVKAFQAARGLEVDGIVGAKTAAQLASVLGVPVAPGAIIGAMPPPWYANARLYLGLREIPGAKSNPTILGWTKPFAAWVRSFFKNDDIPWCGLFVGHELAVALPSEIMPGNPLAAASYAVWGVSLREPAVGAVLVFTRQGGGHVGFYAGEDATCFHVLGGNQSNAVSIARIKKDRLTAIRWPATWSLPTTGRVRLTAAGAPSTNEA